MELCPKCDKDKNHSKRIIERFVLLFIPNFDFSFLLHIKHWFLNFFSTLSSVITVGHGGCKVILGTGNVVSAWIAHRECQNDITLPSAALWHLGSAGVCMFAWVSRGGGIGWPLPLWMRVQKVRKYRKGTIWSHLRWYGHCCVSPGATMRLRHFRHVPTDLQGWFNSVFLCADTQANPPATWPAPPLPTEGDWPRINGLLSWDAHIQRNLMHAHLCKHRADAAGTWSQRSSPGVPAAASASACPLSDSLTFSAAATHRSARTGRAREGIRDREWSIKEAAEEGEYMLWGWWNDSWLEQKIASESW